MRFNIPFGINEKFRCISEAKAGRPQEVEGIHELVDLGDRGQLKPGDICEISMAVNEKTEFYDFLLIGLRQIGRGSIVEIVAALKEPFYLFL